MGCEYLAAGWRGIQRKIISSETRPQQNLFAQAASLPSLRKPRRLGHPQLLRLRQTWASPPKKLTPETDPRDHYNVHLHPARITSLTGREIGPGSRRESAGYNTTESGTD